ncbi:sensor histidine kinase [Konateibacter massiliensis]|uniref:sensor histidine kinase n=1 Tax=Konateibacter massiliensis TaxID=2002841 RepID=UPI000C146239|nr:sensor histidine kinase [Konateibacter massiliensis]
MIKRLKHGFENLKLQDKMLVVYLLFAGAFCFISIVALQLSLNIYDKKLYEKSLQELDFFTQEVNDGLEDIENLSYTLAMNTEVQEHLAEAAGSRYLSQEYYYHLHQLRSIFLDEINIHPLVQNIMYVDRKNVSFLTGTDRGPIEEETYQELLKGFEEKRGGYVAEAPTEDYPYLVSGRDILEKKNASFDYLGTLFITSDISGMIKKKKESLESVNSTLFVFSDKGIIYSEGEEVPDMSEFDQNQGYQIVRYQGERYFMCYLKSAENNWIYVNYFPYSEIFGQTMLVRYLMLGLFVCMFFFMVAIMKKVSATITRPLKRLSESMQTVKNGDFNSARELLPAEKRMDEVGMLSQEFLVMLERIDVLIHENYTKQLLIKDTKYKMLQAQINPHFLYNTLNALNWLVKAERNQEAGKMIMELGKLLRASFAQESYATVEEEIEMAKSYITIQQFRYQKRANFHIETEGEFTGYQVPRMILQPLIENAIYHGVEKSLVSCDIVIKVIEEENEIILKVRDTGPGMDEEELRMVRDFTIKPKGHGIGLKNIWERLKIAFPSCEILIESVLGEGTSITIRIPKMTEVQNV